MNWWNLLILLVLVAGHCEVLVAIENRLHALRLGRRVLKTFRAVHDVVLFGFPLVLFWFVGLRGPRLLVGGRWSELPAGWAVYLTVCGIGAVSLVVSVLRHQRYRPPQNQLANHTHRFDIAESLGYRPVGRGRGKSLTRVPGNQIFQLEVVEKVFHLPQLPADWDGLSIGHITDLHFHGIPDRPYFEKVCEHAAAMQPDLFVFTGDLLDRQEYVQWLPDTLGRLRSPLGCYFVLGNHDWYLKHEAIRQAMVDLGWIDLGGRITTREHLGRPLVLAGTEAPWIGRHPDLPTRSNDAFTLLLSHTPDNLPWARESGVDLMLSGHNHGGQIRLPMIGPVYTPSRYGCRYAAGVFWEPPTLLYVSRGVSGKQALRWNCPPEITKIILKHGSN